MDNGSTLSKLDETPTVQETFGTSFVYHGVQEPYEGVRQLVNHVASRDVLPSVHLVDKPAETKFGSLAWHAQALGAGAGMVIPFALLKGTLGRGTTSLALAAESSPAMFRAGTVAVAKAPVIESALIGAAYDGLFRPVDDNANFWQKRGINSAIGGVTFGVMGKVSQGLGNTTREFNGIFESSLAKRTLTGAKNGILAGMAGGSVNHEARALADGNDLFNAQGIVESAYAFAFPGAVMGGWHAASAKPAVHPMQRALERYEFEQEKARDANPRIQKLEELGRTRELTETEEHELTALSMHPRDPYLQELTKKEWGHTLTEEEGAVLFSTRQFPTDPVTRELARRELLDQLSLEEKETLRLKRMERSSFKDKTPEYDALWKRADNKDPNVARVEMWDGKSILTKPGGPDKAIFTYGLGGCTTTTVLIPQANGGKFVAMTHYPPTDIAANVSHIESLIGKGVSGKSSTERPTVVIRELEGYGYDGPGFHRPEAGSSDFSQQLTRAIRRQLGDNVDIQYSPYSGLYSIGSKDGTTFIARVPASPRKAINWKAAEGEGGKLGTDKPTLLQKWIDGAADRSPMVRRWFGTTDNTESPNLNEFVANLLEQYKISGTQKTISD